MSILKTKNKVTGEWEEIITIKGDKGDPGEQAEVVDNLISSSTTSALSANQGKVLEDKKLNIISDEEVTLGALTIGRKSQFYEKTGKYGLDMQNSDMIGVNNIFFNDAADSSEGLLWLKTGKTSDSQVLADYDLLAVLDEKVYLNNKLYSSYRVGDIVITETNTNPASDFGGTWTLIDKGFKSQTIVITPTINPTNTISCSCGCIFKGDSIRIRISVVNNVEVADSTVEIATFEPSDFGLTSWQYDQYILGGSDGGNTVMMGQISAANNNFNYIDSFNESLAISNTTYFQVSYQSTYTAMLDSWCDKFYWRKVSE